MRHNQVADICRKIVAKALKVEESKISQDQWDYAIFDFAREAERWNYEEDFVRKEFQYRVEDLLERIKKWKNQAWVGALQRHHDYYVFLYRQGKLTHIDDQRQYAYAMERENEGKVKPLADNAVSPFG